MTLFSHIRLISLFAAATLSVSLPVYAKAQARPQAPISTVETDTALISELQSVVEWAARYNSLQEGIFLLFNNDIVDQALDAYERNDRGTIANLVNMYNQTRTEHLVNIQTEISNFPPRPELNILTRTQPQQAQNLQQGLNAQSTRLANLYQDAKRGSGLFETLMRRMSKGDDTGLNTLAELQAASENELLQSETFALETQLAATELDHPNASFLQMNIAVHYFSRLELELDRIEESDPASAQKRKKAIDDMAAHINHMQNIIQEGRNKAHKKQSELRNFLPQSQNATDRQNIQNLLNIINSYHAAFDVEGKILQNIREVHKLYSSNIPLEAYEAELSRIDAQLPPLIDERFKLYEQRFDALQALQ